MSVLPQHTHPSVGGCSERCFEGRDCSLLIHFQVLDQRLMIRLTDFITRDDYGWTDSLREPHSDRVERTGTLAGEGINYSSCRPVRAKGVECDPYQYQLGKRSLTDIVRGFGQEINCAEDLEGDKDICQEDM